MLVRQAKAVAHQWLLEAADTLPGFRGALFHGSTTWLADDALLAPGSDVDLLVVLADAEPPLKLGKFRYQGVLLEVSYLAEDEIASPEMVLGSAHLAGSFRGPNLIADPTGQLAALQAAVARDYARRRWVRARCKHVEDKILRNFRTLEAPAPLHDQVSAWLFGTGLTTHMPLVAGLQNPTVRRRYAAVRELLAAYGRSDVYRPLLELLGCAHISRARVEQHLAALSNVFDAAKVVIASPFFFSSDISDDARPIAIDGSRDLIERGLHREALFWIVATYSRCAKVLYHDAPVEVQERHAPGYQALLADLGMTSAADLVARAVQVRDFLPQLWEVSEAILAHPNCLP
jgi:hypothetical protein